MDKITLTLPGSIRSKKNSKRIIMVGGKNVPRRPMLVPSKAYEKWEIAAWESVLYGEQPYKYFTCPVHVKVTAYYKGKQPDLSGVLESVGDCLEGIAWKDDKQIVSWDGSRLQHDLKNPRTIVEVTEYEN